MRYTSLMLRSHLVDQAVVRAVDCRFDTAAAVVAAHDHVLDLQHLDGELQHRHQVDVGVHDEVGDVAVDEHLPAAHPDHLVGVDTAVGAPDEQVLGRLTLGEALEVIRIDGEFRLDPSPVVLEELLVRGCVHTHRMPDGSRNGPNVTGTRVTGGGAESGLWWWWRWRWRRRRWWRRRGGGASVGTGGGGGEVGGASVAPGGGGGDIGGESTPVTVELSAAGGVLLRLRSTKKTTVAMTASATRTATMIQVLELELPPGVHSAVRVASPSATKSASGVMSQVAVEPSVEVALLSPSEPGADTLKTIEKSSSRLTPSSSVMSAASPPPVSSSTPSQRGGEPRARSRPVRC